MSSSRPPLTLDAVMRRVRDACDRVVDDTARAFLTDAVLAGQDPDSIDATVADYRRRASQSIDAQLAAMRSELVSWAAETPGGPRNVQTETAPGTPGGPCCTAPVFKSRP